jgi:Zn-dependent peptidase ImmA (M78 family)
MKERRSLMITRIDEYVTDTLRSYKDQSIPIDPLYIAKHENLRVELLPNVDKRFGRIEYIKEAGNFIVYCSKQIEYYDPIARFSLCHELGHFFIEEHRNLLIRGGKAHISKSGFICDSLIEREADEFAAKFLIPPLFFRDYIADKKRLNLEGLMELANMCQASLTSACIRYINADIEPCAMVMINNSTFKKYSPSESAAKGGFANLGHRNIPEPSIVNQAIQAGASGNIFKAQSSTKEWYSSKRREAGVWEEAFVLGKTGWTLVMLYLDLVSFGKDGYFLPSEKYYR